MPLRFLRRSWGRAASSVLALALGVGLVCALDLVNRAVLRAFVEIVDTMAGRASLQVTVDDGALFAEEVAANVAKVAGVERAVPIVAASAFTVDDRPQALTVQGFDLTDDGAARIYEPGEGHLAGVEDPLVFLNQPDSILIVRELAQRHGLSEGSRIELDTPTGRRSFTVRGVLDPRGIGRAFGGGLVLMDLYAAEAVFARPGYINRVDIVVSRDAEVAAVARAIERLLPRGLRVETPAQRKADLNAVMLSLQMLLQALGLIALAAAFMIAFNRLTSIFEQRAWLCGVIRAIGMDRGAVCWMLVKESLVLGAAGAVLGLAFGIALARVLLPVIAATTALNFRLVAPDADLSIHGSSLAVALLLGLGAALAAALLPAWRASQVSIVATIRGRGTEMPSRLQRPAWIGLVLVLAAGAVAVAVQAQTRDALWGVAATILAVLATKMIARPFLQYVGAPLTSYVGARLQRSGRLIGWSISRNPRRNARTIAMVAIGLGAVFWLAIVAYSFETSAIRVFEESMRADLVVSSSNIGSGSLESPVDDRFGETLRLVDGVASVVGIRLANAELGGGPIVLDAFDPDYFRNPDFGQWPLLGAHRPDAWSAVAAGDAVVVSSNLAQNLRVGVGDVLDLPTANGSLRLAIAGITTDFASPRGTIEMSRAVYAQHWNDPQVTRFFVEIADGAEPAAVRERILAALGSGGMAWRIISSGDLVEYWRTQIRRAFASVYVLAGVILAVILLGMVDNLSASVAERTRELGMVRAIGVHRRSIWALVLGEAFVITAFGLGLAFAQALAVGNLWVGSTIPNLLGWVIGLHIPVVPLAGVAAATLSSCLLAALLPAYRAAAVEPATALRWE